MGSNMIKVVILGENGSVHIQKWIQALALHKILELHVISFDRGVKYPEVKYYPLKIFFNNKIDYLLNVKRVNKYIKEIKPMLVHSHYATSYGYLGMKSNFHPFLVTGWGADIFDSPKEAIMRQLLIRIFKKADAITVLSRITLKEMKKLSPKPVELIPFGVDISKFRNIKSKNDNIIRIGTIRTLSEKYGVEYLIRAFAMLSHKYTNIRLEIVGDGPLKPKLISLANELKISDKVTFHGYVNQNADFDKYIQILSNLDIFAILSILDSETFGVAAVEASACSIPVVATHVGGLPEVIENNVTGLLVKPCDAEDTAQALEKLIKDENLRMQMGSNGRKKVENEYDWDKNVNKMISIYQQLTKQT